jgi:transposase
VKTPEQQAVLALHRLRAGWIKMRTAQVNALRGLLYEFGIVLPVGVGRFRSQAPAVLEDAENGLPGLMRHSLAQGLELLAELDRRITDVESQLHAWHRENSHCQRVSQVPGIGVLTATAMVASAGSPESFENARQAVAWVGLAPRQVSSGGKPTLLGISKRGDAYLRMLLIHGARSVVAQAKRRPAPDDWLHRLLGRAHPNVAVCALAAKNMRTAWALWRHERDYQPGYRPA